MEQKVIDQPTTRPTDHPTPKYIPQDFEAGWMQRWEADELYKTAPADERPKAYILDFFPYPSGDGLSVGHCRNYVPTDVMSRYYRMKGYNVLHPMGWDAFGLPAENAAIKTKTNPAKLIAQYSANYKRQFRLIGISFDWSREINSSTPEYYRWTQWVFLQLYEAWYDPRADAARPIAELEKELGEKGTAAIDAAQGIEGNFPRLSAAQWNAFNKRERSEFLSNFRLAYRKPARVNWCPVDKTVLANEEVHDGRCWRCGSQVIEKNLPQWFFRITAYSERLINDLDTIDWPEHIKLMQRNWIGKSIGAEADFKTGAGYLRIFTTRPDTLWGATFMVLAPEHPFVETLTTAEHKARVNQYVKEASAKTDIERETEGKDKTGVFTGAYATNPVNGERIPIWVADYVMMGYGTGAIMSVPAHDQRDFEFARKFHLPIRVVIRPEGESNEIHSLDADTMERAYPHEGVMVNSGPFDGTPADVAVEQVTQWLEEKGIGAKRINYKFRDWGISRQRYWGTPIPIIHTDDGEVAADHDALPVELPNVNSYEPTATGESPLATIPEWVNVTLPDGTHARRETDTMGTFACSSWYYMRFADPRNEHAPFDAKEVNYWCPVDTYVGGAEHAVMHLLYARFWTKALYDLGYVNFIEPFERLRNQGMILSPQVKDGKYEKMSKSKGNVITPDEMVSQYGADALRAYEMFISEFSQATPWQIDGLAGTFRWLKRVWDLMLAPNERPAANETTAQADRVLNRKLHQTIHKVESDIEAFAFNTVISALMEFTNVMYDLQNQVSREMFDHARETLLLVLAPIAPFMTEELWMRWGSKYSIHQQKYPQYDSAAAAEESFTLVVQVNGKVRGKIELPVGVSEAEAKQKAFDDPNVKKWMEGKNIAQVVYVPGRLMNVVVT
ncbi:MAG: leucine--tRNA ligase [Chloroflexi bacterium]|nr:leucine--tRNA ligase [Chloroflexota bacterium]